MNLGILKWKKSLFLLLGIFAILNMSAQNGEIINVSGVVKDAQGELILGASVREKGNETNGTVTDFDGKFSIKVKSNSSLIVSYVGYNMQEVPVTGKELLIVMTENAEFLKEVVVIGYGSVRKEDMTGAITSITDKDFSKGVVTSPSELISGKVAGVQITSNGGRAGSGSRIRIRGGASLNASNDPLIVIDGVPMDVNGVSGAADPLSLINPNDIESMNVLKDASATAIYGSRASNGVIIITTKKGGGDKGKVKLNFSTQNSLAYNSKKVDVLSTEEFVNIVNQYGSQRYIDMLGTASTDWQDEIYRTAFATDNNLSVSGHIKDMPYRVSASYLNQSGVLKRDNLQRATASINVSPKFFDEHLSVNLNLKGTYANQKFGNTDAIGAALRMDPTKPVKADGFDQYNGFWTWESKDKHGMIPNSLATTNPVALLEAKDDESNVYRSLGNIQFDYKMHFLPELKANLNLGYDIAKGKGEVFVQPWAPNLFTNGGYDENIASYNGGEHTKYEQAKRNLLFEFYLNYNKEFKEINSRVDVMAGYTYQDWKTTDNQFAKTNYAGDIIITEPTYPKYINQNTLISYYGRLNYTFHNRYLLTATVRRDGSSRFSEKNRWGLFPSVALAWRISEEEFLKNAEALSNLKLRLGYGVTGQQEIDNFGYLATYSLSDQTARYQFGDKVYNMWRPNGYDPDRKWEQTETYNIGLDYGFIDNRLSGTLDFYYKDTKDLLNTVPLPAGSSFTNQITKNIGSMTNKGFEFSVNYVAIDNDQLRWDLGFNATYNKSEITKLFQQEKEGAISGIETGGVSGGTGTTVQIHSVGYAPYSFYLYKQLYDEAGNPIEGAYADLNEDGVINEDDKYIYKKAAPDWYLGFNTNLSYQKWSLGTSLRASIGNYVYNNIYSDAGNLNQLLNPSNFLMNSNVSLLDTNFANRNLRSDYYVQNASFLKMDYITLGYDFGSVLGKNTFLKASFTAQNVFTITKYKGVDPEMTEGIDNNFYPNPRTFTLGLNLSF